MRIDFLGLEAFLSIADHGSFHRAAASLNLSQTALSHRMRKLEEGLGVKLLTRTTRQLCLTPAGIDLLAKARKLMGDMGSALDDIRHRGDRQPEWLNIGCLPTIAVHYLPTLLRQLHERFPNVNVRIFDLSKQEIADLVHRGEAELGITIVSADRKDLAITPLVKEAFVVICAGDHPLVGRKSVAWADLRGEPLVRVSTQTGNRQLIDDALGPRRDEMTWRYEVQHLVSAVGLVRAGLGLAIVPRLAVSAVDAPGIAILELRNPGITRILGVVTRRGAALSAAADELLSLLRQHVRQPRGGSLR